MKPRLRAEDETGMIVSPRVSEVILENLRRCGLVPMSKNSVLDGFRRSLLRFIQDRMSLNVDDNIWSELSMERYVKLSIISIELIGK